MRLAGLQSVVEIRIDAFWFLLSRFADPHSGEAEPFLLGLTFKDYATAERVAAWTQERLNDPELEIQVLESSRGDFKIKAAYISHGRMVRALQLNQGVLKPRALLRNR